MSVIGTHTGPGPARTSEGNSSLLFYQSTGNVCSIIRTCSYLKKKRKSTDRKHLKIYSEMLNKLHFAWDSHLPISMCSLSLCLLLRIALKIIKVGMELTSINTAGLLQNCEASIVDTMSYYSAGECKGITSSSFRRFFSPLSCYLLFSSLSCVTAYPSTP